MRLAIWYICIGFSLIIACSDPERPELPVPINKNLIRLNEVLNGPLATPEGKLKAEFFYYGPQTLQSRIDFYYDEAGKELLKVRIKDFDTTRVYLNEYLENGALNRTSVFGSGAEGLFFDFDFQRFYEDDGRTIRVEQGRDGKFKEYERFEFDDLGRKITYRRGDDEIFELYEYYYNDEEDRKIREEHFREWGMENPFYRYKYFYNERDLLIARSLKIISPEYRPAFEYKYDSNDRLIEEITNDLYFGTQAVERKIFDYY
ncbi:hypothetical protein Q4534_08855 [Cyclobacterium sp. 1_MG-2023]|uniref:hypothetical protein n=1 Tax=Cyclobacterium sp. 1_MG-2023 TaxID=3062681 RepID=UPI0026E22DF6|nr:hypothetical protein [Cyclobacterium sp. 1_MG-2023]MDO6437513.1 hypothetical protein [Cyclobacterium sp. 1_MG-2023]